MNQPKPIVSFAAFGLAGAVAFLLVDGSDPLFLVYLFVMTSVLYLLLVRVFRVADTPPVIELPKGKLLTRAEKWLFQPEQIWRVLRYWMSKRPNR